MYTIATAAAAVGRNKTAILRAIKAGKISAAKDENGEWQIDPADLHRIYPLLRSASMRGNDMQPHLYQSPLLTPVLGSRLALPRRLEIRQGRVLEQAWGQLSDDYVRQGKKVKRSLAPFRAIPK